MNQVRKTKVLHRIWMRPNLENDDPRVISQKTVRESHAEGCRVFALSVSHDGVGKKARTRVLVNERCRDEVIGLGVPAMLATIVARERRNVFLIVACFKVAGAIVFNRSIVERFSSRVRTLRRNDPNSPQPHGQPLQRLANRPGGQFDSDDGTNRWIGMMCFPVSCARTNSLST